MADKIYLASLNYITVTCSMLDHSARRPYSEQNHCNVGVTGVDNIFDIDMLLFSFYTCIYILSVPNLTQTIN